MEICICVFKKHSIIISNTHFHLHEFSVLQSAHKLVILTPIFVGEKLRLTKVEDLPKVIQIFNDTAGHLILSLGQWVSTRSDCALQRTRDNIWRQFWLPPDTTGVCVCVRGGCFRHLAGRGQGCCDISYGAQGSPTSGSYLPLSVKSIDVEQPWPRSIDPTPPPTHTLIIWVQH